MDEAEVGYYFEVDLKYPEELHNKHKDLPCAPDKESPRKEWFSDYQQSFNLKGKSSEKLLMTLHDKESYVLHQRNLRQYLSAGLRVRKIQRILKFKQSLIKEVY